MVTEPQDVLVCVLCVCVREREREREREKERESERARELFKEFKDFPRLSNHFINLHIFYFFTS